MRAVVLERFRELMAVREVPLPSMGSDEIFLRIRACGFCGTDIKIWMVK